MLDVALIEEGWPKADWQGLAENVIQTVFNHSSIAPMIAADREMEIAIRLTDDTAIQALNAEWRGKDAPTNVLSFPIDAPDSVQPGPIMLGDIILALGVCEREAEERNISLADHATHLIAHGVLHLLGFDHIEEDEAIRMENIERDVLEELGLHNPYEDET